jgi:hypothetical protein
MVHSDDQKKWNAKVLPYMSERPKDKNYYISMTSTRIARYVRNNGLKIEVRAIRFP